MSNLTLGYCRIHIVQGYKEQQHLEQPLFLFWLDKFVNGVVSRVLSFIDIEELMFVNVYISYKPNFEISHHITLGVPLLREHVMMRENPEVFTEFGSGYLAMIII